MSCSFLVNFLTDLFYFVCFQMTIAKAKGASNGGACLVSRTKTNGSRSDWPNSKNVRILVSFNTKDELELKTIPESSDKETLLEKYKIEEIIECSAGDFKEFNSKNVLIVEVYKNQVKEELVLHFDNEQEFRRTLFTYKYFKMRNRLTHSSSESSSEGSPSPSPSTKSRSSVEYSSIADGTISNYIKSFDYSRNLNHQYVKKYDDSQNYSYKSLDYMPSHKKSDQKDNNDEKKSKYDLMQVTDNNGVTHMSVESKSDLGEIDGLIYTDVDYDDVDFTNSSSSELVDLPQKYQKKKQPNKRIKGRAPPPPHGNETEIVKGQVVRVTVERLEKHAGKEAINFAPRTQPPLTKGLIGEFVIFL